jgi:hypothetical protein
VTDDDPIEVYLDELLLELRGAPRMVRRVLAESEAHLRDALSQGLDADEAIRRFGDPRRVAQACNRRTGVAPSVLVRQLLLAVCLLGSVGCAAIGASGVVSLGMDAVLGPKFVAGDLPTITYTPDRCAEYRALAPKERSCLAAAARHHTDEVVIFRMATGVLGLFGLAAWSVLRRRWRATPATGALPPALLPGIGAALFGVAALALTAEATQGIGWRSASGLGQWLSAAFVSGAVAAGFGIRLLRALHHPTLGAETVST